MTLSVRDFPAFFKEVYGFGPFQWQTRLLESLVATGTWPQLIDAPTGSGKSSVVDLHVFANALSAVGAGPRVPRRMALVVNRRALVDSHADRAGRLRQLLDSPPGEATAAVSVALRRLSNSGEPLLTTSLRGGIPTDRHWIDDPVTTMVIAATPDMWGSRLLFRGYGTSRLARPREAGLLALDSVVVVDEAHLSRQLVRTGAAVSMMVSKTSTELGPMPGLQIVSTTATPTAAENQEGLVVGVQDADLTADPALNRRLTAPKLLRLLESDESDKKGAARGRYATQLAEEARDVLERAQALTGEQETALVVVNRPLTAVHVADVLAKMVGPEAVQCWVGRMRPMDIARMREQHPGLFSVAGDPSVRFLVATQTVEVGVDIDCAGLVTELAPGSALVQRFGRVNRLGCRPQAEVVVVTPASKIEADRPPYTAEELTESVRWLRSIGDGGDVSPWSMRTAPPPEEAARRRLFSDLFPGDAELLARTSTPMFADPDLAFWLRDNLDDRPDPVGVVLRNLPKDDLSALSLLRHTPPTAWETFPALIWEARQNVERILAPAKGTRGDSLPARAFLWRDDDVVPVDSAAQISPGDTVILDPHSVTLRGVVVADPPALPEQLRLVWGDEASTVLLAEDESGIVGDFDLLRLLAGETPEAAQELYDELFPGQPRQISIPVGLDLARNGRLPWIVLRQADAVLGDEGVRQEWTPNRQNVVTLTNHQNAVSGRALSIATRLGLPEELREALELGGRHHDDGKQDTAFQRMLRDSSNPDLLADTIEPIAKSTGRSAQQVRRRGSTRPGWRHEQLSAVHASIALAEHPSRALVARLTGTSHGHGRPFFPRGAADLLEGSYDGEVAEAARQLFESGSGWSDVLASTDSRFGVWGVAYLEALLRSADIQVSKEGS